MTTSDKTQFDFAAGGQRHVRLHDLLGVGSSLVHLAALCFYALGRGLLKLFRAPRSETGVPEAIVGFLVVAGLVAALVKLPLRLLFAALMR